MLDGLWRLRGSVVLRGPATDKVALDRIEHLLLMQRKRVTQRGAHFVAFDAPPHTYMLTPNWYAMAMFERGRFWTDEALDGRLLRYDLRSLRGFLFCLFATAVFFMLGLVSGGPSQGLLLATFAFAVLYGMNMLVVFLRVPRLIKRTVHQ